MNRTRTYTVNLKTTRRTQTIPNMTDDRLAGAVNESVLVIERVTKADGARFVEEAHSFPLSTVTSWTFTADVAPADDRDEAERTARAAEVQEYNLTAAEAARRDNESPGGIYYGTRWASNT